MNAFTLGLLVALLAVLAGSAMSRDARAEGYSSSGGTCAPPHCYRTAPGRPPDNNSSNSGSEVTPYTGESGGWQPSLSTSPYGYPPVTQPRSPSDGTYVPPHDRPLPDRPHKKNWRAKPDMAPYTHGEWQPSFKDRPPSSRPDYPGGMQHPYPSGGSAYLPPIPDPRLGIHKTTTGGVARMTPHTPARPGDGNPPHRPLDTVIPRVRNHGRSSRCVKSALRRSWSVWKVRPPWRCERGPGKTSGQEVASSSAGAWRDFTFQERYLHRSSSLVSGPLTGSGMGSNSNRGLSPPARNPSVLSRLSRRIPCSTAGSPNIKAAAIRPAMCTKNSSSVTLIPSGDWS